MTVLILVIYVLTCARLTRLINGDTILDGARLWLVGRKRGAETRYARTGEKADFRRFQRWEKAWEWSRCPWCAGLWIALALAYVPVWLIGWPWWTLLPVALAGNHLVGVFAFAADTDEIAVEDAD